MKGQSWQQDLEGGHRRRRSVIGLTTRRRLFARCLLVLGVIGIYYVVNLHLLYRDALRAKYLPTEFADPADALANATEHLHGLAESKSPNAKRRQKMLRDRDNWKQLGGGREGEAFVYEDSLVIKVYNEVTTPFRNCAPVEGTGLRWPSEIPAALVMGGTGNTPPEASDDPFLPVTDFFRAPSTPGGPLRWHLVTPFLRAGTLKKLAFNTSTSGMPYRQVDALYRPSFEFLLAGLQRMHEENNLCHDDIKLDNIFVASPDAPMVWVLADLGNARQPDHPYHTSALWTSDTAQHPDCRINDVVRLTKSYLAFVRAASGPSHTAAFDADLMEGVTRLSKLYWSVVNTPAPAGEVLERSKSRPPPRDANVIAELASSEYRWSYARSVAVARNLRVGANDAWGRFMALSGILGTPVASCSGGHGGF